MSAKAAGRNPRELGQQLADYLTENRPAHVEALEIAGPGFVNFRLAATWLHDVLAQVLAEGEADYGRINLGDGLKVNIEFVSANPTGPIHAGGGRWGAYGDSLARIMQRCGYDTHKEFYVNDRGNQTELFGQSLAARRDGKEVPENGYQGAYIDEWAAEMPPEADPIAWGIERSLADAAETLAAMNVEFDTWSSEKALVARGAEAEVFERLKQSGLVYDADGATWLKTSEFGDNDDRVLVKSDGNYTYFMPDIAYHLDKYNRGDHLIDILGADHHGYAPRMRAALIALGKPEDSYEVIIGQNVKLVRGGVEVKMSKRAGELVEIRDLVDEVGPDVARFAYLLQSVDSPQTLDLDLLKAQAAENPVYYVQYANARIHSLGRQAAERGIERSPLVDADLSVLTHERELELLRQLSALGEVLEIACAERAPHKITTWVRELASAFHGFYRDCPVLRSDVDPKLAQARLWLAEATRIGLAIGLLLTGSIWVPITLLAISLPITTLSNRSGTQASVDRVNAGGLASGGRSTDDFALLLARSALISGVVSAAVAALTLLIPAVGSAEFLPRWAVTMWTTSVATAFGWIALLLIRFVSEPPPVERLAGIPASAANWVAGALAGLIAVAFDHYFHQPALLTEIVGSAQEASREPLHGSRSVVLFAITWVWFSAVRWHWLTRRDRDSLISLTATLLYLAVLSLFARFAGFSPVVMGMLAAGVLLGVQLAAPGRSESAMHAPAADGSEGK